MRKISTGENSTLGTYRKIAVLMSGEESKAVEFLDRKISESPNGEDEEVIQDKRQMLLLIVSLETQ